MPKTIENNSLPSLAMASFTLSKIPVQSIPNFQPKNGFSQPAGITFLIMSGETLEMAMTPIVIEVIVRMVNCITSVMTTLIMPPLMTYSEVSPRMMIAYMFSSENRPADTPVKCQGSMTTANLPIPLKAYASMPTTLTSANSTTLRWARLAPLPRPNRV